MSIYLGSSCLLQVNISIASQFMHVAGEYIYIYIYMDKTIIWTSAP